MTMTMLSLTTAAEWLLVRLATSYNLLMRFVDYSVYRSMVVRRPSSSVVPPINKRLAVQRYRL